MAPAPYLPNNHIPGINGASGVDNLTRRDNSFVYESPSFGGLKLSAMVSLGEQNKLNSESEMSNKYGNSYAAQSRLSQRRLRYRLYLHLSKPGGRSSE